MAGSGALAASSIAFCWISDDFDLRFPFGAMWLDWPVIGSVCLQVFLVFGHCTAAFGFPEAVVLWRNRHKKLQTHIWTERSGQNGWL